VPNTCFGLLFLSRGRAPVVFNKLQYEVEPAGEKAKAANWNQRPRDAANLAKWVGKQTERYLNWQIVNLKVSVDELHDAPILYVSGDQPLELSKEAEGKLKQFVEQGGLILGNADCGSAKFADSFRKLGQRLFPAYEFRELPANHVIYTNEQFKGAKHPLSLLGLSNGARELMLLFPQQDPGKYWQTGAYGGHEELHEVPGDVFLYAVDKQNLRTKGQTYVVHRDEKVKAERTIRVARIRYAGNWDPEPGGWRRLANLMHNQNRIDIQLEPVKPGEGKLAGFKLAHMTGTTAFKLSVPERAELQKFVAAGGSLIIDAAGGSIDFSSAAEIELAAMFPGESKQLGAALGVSHPLFGSGDSKMKEVAYRNFARKTLTGGLNAPRLRGITIGNRLAVVYSPEDLSVGLVGQPIDGIYGYDPKSATELMTRIISHLSPASATGPGGRKAGAKK
jgi:hypothetical protein